MKKKAKSKGKVIVPNIPADARRNLAKLERGLERKQKAAERQYECYHKLKTIWQEEGIDAALLIAPQLNYKKHDAFRLIESWVFPKKYAERVEYETLGRENDGLQRCS